MTLIEKYIELCKEHNEAMCEGKPLMAALIEARRRGFLDAVDIMGSNPSLRVGRLIIEGDLAMMEIYGDVPMTGGILHAPAKKLNASLT